MLRDLPFDAVEFVTYEQVSGLVHVFVMCGGWVYKSAL